MEQDLSVASGAHTDRRRFRAVADAATATWLNWLDHQLDAPDDARSTVVAGLMTIIDGLLLQAAAHTSVAVHQAYQWLAARIDDV